MARILGSQCGITLQAQTRLPRVSFKHGLNPISRGFDPTLTVFYSGELKLA